MEIPQKVNIRLVFKFNNEETFTKFYWFKIDNDELYWGSPGKSKIEHYSITPTNGEITITIPEDFDKYPSIDSKISYHKSGQVHIKKEFEDKSVIYDQHSKWKLKETINKPVNIYTVLSKVIDKYTEKIDNPNSKKNHSLKFNIPSECLSDRFYMECFLCPEGTFEFPKPLLVNIIPNENITSISLSKDLILVIRFAIIDSINHWQPDAEISLIPKEI